MSSPSQCASSHCSLNARNATTYSMHSPPLCTQQGYKLCILLYSNGQGDGKNTHIAVYVCLMTGEYDDQLQWPFVGDVIIQLLNWKENKKHHQTTVSVKATSGFVRVLEGQYGPILQGYSRFISHSSLSYNSTTNTEYIHDDCLRFRVSMIK